MAVSDKLAALARAAVERLFLRTKIRMGLIQTPRGDRRLYVSAHPSLTLGGLYEAAARAHGAIPRASAVGQLRRVAGGYLEAQKAAAAAAVQRAVHAATGGLVEAPNQEDVKAALKEALGGVLERLKPAVERIVATEAVAARNLGGIEAVAAVSKAAGVDDPVMYWVVVRDGKLCSECRRVHLMPDGVTPRLWRLSEMGRAYHRRGQDSPSLFGLHPHCRCAPTHMLPGFGFDAGGNVRYVGPQHDELAKQRG